MSSVAQKLYTRVTNLSFAFVLALSSLTALAPFIFAQNAAAVSSAVYAGIPASQPAAYTSLGYAATSTKEFGDRLVLGADNRLLDSVTVSFTSWACETGGWNTFDCESGVGASFAHPVTVNLYETTGTDAVGALIASKTQTISALYRPSADDINCIGGDEGKWYSTAAGQCYNGIAFDATFDFSDQDEILPEQVIATVAYNTSNYGADPIGVSGPYDSLNVSLTTTAPAVGSDYDGNVMYWDTTYPGYTAGLKADSGWPYHLVIDINADSVPGPTLLTPADGASFQTSALPVTQTWSSVSGATQYLYESYTQDPLVDDTPFYSQLRTTTSRTIGVTAPEGEYWWRVKAVAPFVSEWSDARTFTVDNTAPASPTLSSPSNNAVVNGASVTQAWASTDTDIDYYIYESYHNSTATSLRWHQEVSGTSKTATNVANTEYWWRVKAVDGAGNESAWSELWKLTIDNNAPIASITSPLDAALLNGNVEVRGTVSDDHLSHYYLLIKNSSNATVHQQTIYTDEFTNELLYNWDTTGVADGEYTIFIAARDLAGNKDGDQTTDGISTDRVTVTVDNTAPDTAISDSTQTTNTPTITGTVDDVNATVTLTVVGVGTFTPIPDALGNWSQTVGPLADGVYNIEVFATDQAGNVGATDAALLTINTAPAVVPDGDEDGDVEGETDEDGGEGQPVATITPIIVPPSANGDEDVQGATDENDDQGTQGANTENTAQVDTDASDGTIFGLAWYWWILILAALTALVWGIIAALRRRQEEA